MSRKRIDPKLPIVAAGDPASNLFKSGSYMDRLVRRLNELFREFNGQVSVYDESVYVGDFDGLNFVGAGVTATVDPSLIGVAEINIPGASGGIAGITIEDEGVTQGAPASVTTLNFVGAPVTATVTAAVGTITIKSPLTTKGDIWGRDTGDNRIPVGTDGKVLTADSTAALGVSWKTPSAGGGTGFFWALVMSAD